jgi:hypothetical protein
MRHKRRLPAHAETSCSVAALLVNINSWSVFCTQPYTEHTLRDGGGAHAPGIINIYDCVRAQKPPRTAWFSHIPLSLVFIFHAEACWIFSIVWFRASVFFSPSAAFNISRPVVGDKQLISKLSLNFDGRPLKCQISADLHASEIVSIFSQAERERHHIKEWRERNFLCLPLASNLTGQTHILQLNGVHLFAQLCYGLITTRLLHSWRKASSFWPMRWTLNQECKEQFSFIQGVISSSDGTKWLKGSEN